MPVLVIVIGLLKKFNLLQQILANELYLRTAFHVPFYSRMPEALLVGLLQQMVRLIIIFVAHFYEPIP